MGLRRTVLLSLGLGLAACAGTGASRRGELVIVGGGLRSSNAEVFAAFLDGAGGRIVVLPTASGVPEQSGSGSAEDLRAHAAAGQTVDVLALHADTPERAFDRDHVDSLSRADAVWFTGGVQSRILAVFRPGRVDTPAYRGLLAVLDRGGRVGGTSAGAAIMSDPMIAGGGSRDSLLSGTPGAVERRALVLEQGMGLFPYGIVDQHFSSRGRVGRLIVALERSGRRLGYGVNDDRALAVDLGSGKGRALGDRAVIVIDAGGARRVGLGRLGLRVSLASRGDELDLRSGRLRPDPGKDVVARSTGGSVGGGEPLQPWGRHTITRLLERLAGDPHREQRAEDEDFALVLYADERTRFHARDAELADLTVVDALLDIRALAGKSRAAEEPQREHALTGSER